MEKYHYWILFGVIGLINGLIKNEKILYLKYLLFSVVIIWTFIYVPFFKNYRLDSLEILLKISLPQFAFYFIPFRLTSYIVNNENNKSKSDEEIITDLLKSLKLDLDLNSTKSFEIIKNQKHLKELNFALENSTKSVVITSGWVSEYVITDNFINKVERAIKRGVKFRIVFGYKDSYGNHTSSNTAIEKLNSLTELYKDQFKIIKTPIHSKILIVDNQYCICGSFNWLSNGKLMPNNEETSLKSYDINFINKMKSYIKNII